MDVLKLLGRNENEMKNEMRIVHTISKDINMNFGLEKCAIICLKRGSVQSKMHVGSTFANDIKEPDPRKTYKYLGSFHFYTVQEDKIQSQTANYLHSCLLFLEIKF